MQDTFNKKTAIVTYTGVEKKMWTPIIIGVNIICMLQWKTNIAITFYLIVYILDCIAV